MRFGLGFLVVSCILLCVSCVLLVLGYISISAVLFCLSMIQFFIGILFVRRYEARKII